MIPVGDRALVLHPGIGHLDQLVAVLLKRVLAEVVLEHLEHRPGLRELLLRLVQILGEDVEVERHVAEPVRSEEHTSELQSLRHLVCRLLLEKKKKIILVCSEEQTTELQNNTGRISVRACEKKYMNDPFLLVS